MREEDLPNGSDECSVDFFESSLLLTDCFFSVESAYFLTISSSSPYRIPYLLNVTILDIRPLHANIRALSAEFPPLTYLHELPMTHIYS